MPCHLNFVVDIGLLFPLPSSHPLRMVDGRWEMIRMVDSRWEMTIQAVIVKCRGGGFDLHESQMVQAIA